MGWRFRKRIKVFPGVHVNISKSGISTSVGVRGASVTFGPNGTYVNAGIPGTGIYTRDKISGSNRGDYNYESHSAVSQSYSVGAESIFLSYPIVSSKGVWLKKFKTWYYVLFLLAALMPMLSLVLYCSADWWMFFSCLLTDFPQFMFCVYLHEDEAGVGVWIKKDNVEETARKVQKSNMIRFCLFVLVALLNILPLMAMNSTFIHLFSFAEPYEGGIGVLLLVVFTMGLWVVSAIVELDKYKDLRIFVIPRFIKADKMRNKVVNLEFQHISLGSEITPDEKAEWKKTDEFEDYQAYAVHQKIVVKDTEHECDCIIQCVGNIKASIEILFDKNIAKNLYPLYVTKYGLPKEGDVKDLDDSFNRTWNYSNQRIVFQLRTFTRRAETIGDSPTIVNQVRIIYIDNQLYLRLKQIRLKRIQLEKEEERKKTLMKEEEQAKKIEEQQRINKIAEIQQENQRRKESEQI